jgi:hypothetical protein
MTQDEIIEMARQVRFGTTLTHDGEIGHFINGSNYLDELVAFAKLVAANLGMAMLRQADQFKEKNNG